MPLLLLWEAARCAREAKLPAGVMPPFRRAVEDWMRAASIGVMGLRALPCPCDEGLDFLDMSNLLFHVRGCCLGATTLRRSQSRRVIPLCRPRDWQNFLEGLPTP